MITTNNLVDCHGCGASSVELLFDLGLMPSVNTFLPREQLSQEKPYPLRVGWCRQCTLVQLIDIIPPADLFTTYQHLSSASQSNVAHLQEVSELLKQRFSISARTRIIDIGSNDGSFLAQFLNLTKHMLGVDPAENVARLAQERYGIQTMTTFWHPTIVSDVKERYGSADLVLALNVVAHTPGVNELLNAVRDILKPGGTFVMEAVYVFSTILKGEFDTVYHEHVYCFSLTALQHLFAIAQLTIVDVEQISTQGGSLRVYAQRASEQPVVQRSVGKLLAQEADMGVASPDLYQAVTSKIESFKIRFRKGIEDLKEKHGHLVGLGASARGVVILNYTQMTPSDIDVVIDDTSLKQGKFIPGVHIPVVPWEYLRTKPVSAFVVLSWNYAPEIELKLRRYITSGQLLIPFPRLAVRSFV